MQRSLEWLAHVDSRSNEPRSSAGFCSGGLELVPRVFTGADSSQVWKPDRGDVFEGAGVLLSQILITPKEEKKSNIKGSERHWNYHS